MVNSGCDNDYDDDDGAVMVMVLVIMTGKGEFRSGGKCNKWRGPP